MGLSLHDNDGNHQRVHIILETPWSGEDFLQQIGRAHRTNAKSNPSYIFISSDIIAEKRIIMTIVKKLKKAELLVL